MPKNIRHCHDWCDKYIHAGPSLRGTILELDTVSPTEKFGMSGSACSSSSSSSSSFPSRAAPSVCHLESDDEGEEVFDGDDVYLGAMTCSDDEDDVGDETDRKLEMSV